MGQAGFAKATKVHFIAKRTTVSPLTATGLSNGMANQNTSYTDRVSNDGMNNVKKNIEIPSTWNA
jgi:hypothetical protein